MSFRQSITHAAAIVVVLAASAANGSTISITPTQASVVAGNGAATFGLFMDFTGVTIQGGGVSLDLRGPISVGSFTPTAYMQTLINGGFAGFGTANANPGTDFLVYFGALEGITGANKLGDISVNASGAGLASIGLFESTAFPFSALNTGAPFNVTGQGTSLLNVAAVPAPATAWLLATGIGTVGAWRSKKSRRPGTHRSSPTLRPACA